MARMGEDERALRGHGARARALWNALTMVTLDVDLTSCRPGEHKVIQYTVLRAMQVRRIFVRPAYALPAVWHGQDEWSLQVTAAGRGRKARLARRKLDEIARRHRRQQGWALRNASLLQLYVGTHPQLASDSGLSYDMVAALPHLSLRVAEPGVHIVVDMGVPTDALERGPRVLVSLLAEVLS